MRMQVIHWNGRFGVVQVEKILSLPHNLNSFQGDSPQSMSGWSIVKAVTYTIKVLDVQLHSYLSL